jgi:hypothetical protein
MIRNKKYHVLGYNLVYLNIIRVIHTKYKSSSCNYLSLAITFMRNIKTYIDHKHCLTA